MAAEARQERCLGLAHDVAGDPHHHVVEAAVLEVVLDAGSPGPRGRPVDDVELAVVGPPHLVLAPVDALPVREEAVPVGREEVVDDDLRPGAGEAREHLARLLVGLGAERVHDRPHLDAVGELAFEQGGHLLPHLALAPAEHEDVHRRGRGLDVREDAREEVDAFDPRLDRRRRRPGEVECRVARPHPGPRGEHLGRGLRASGRHRVVRRRPARTPRASEHLPVRADDRAGRSQTANAESLATGHRR